MATGAQFTAEEVCLLLDENLSELEQECVSGEENYDEDSSDDCEDSRVEGMLAGAYFDQPRTNTATTPAERDSLLFLDPEIQGNQL